MAAGDVARFVGDDADHLVGSIGLHQGARVYEHVPAIEHEGVEGIILNDAHLDAPGTEPRRLENRLGVVVEDVLDLSVANEGQVLRRRRDGRCQEPGDGKPAQEGGSGPIRL